MGFFDKIFGSKKEEKVLEVYAPVTGKQVNLEDVPDKTFASKMLGDGQAIMPNGNGEIVAPFDGKLVQVFKTGHAFTVEANNGVNVLVHFGINTVDLEGQGFTKLVQEGSKVKKGEPIIRYDYDFLSKNAQSVITPVIVLESDDLQKIEVVENKDVIAGQTVILKITK